MIKFKLPDHKIVKSLNSNDRIMVDRIILKEENPGIRGAHTRILLFNINK